MATNDTRSRNMAAIRSSDTEPERRLRSLLHRAGFRFRKNDKRFPGSPDIYLPRWRCAVFVHGCYWHRHAGCPFTTTPRTNLQFWNKKFDANIARDLRNQVALRKLGIRPLIVWECAISAQPERTLLKLIRSIKAKALPR